MIKIWFNRGGTESSRWCVQQDEGEIHTVREVCILCPARTEYDGQFGRIIVPKGTLEINLGNGVIV